MTKEQALPWSALSVLVLGTFMGVLDSSIVNVALPHLMALFSATEDEIQWVMTIYLLVGGMVIPAAGFLGDRFGYKKAYLGSIVAFVLGSALCGLSWSTTSMVTARAIQALGGGMVIPLSMAYLFRIWPREKIGLATGLWGMTMTVAPAIGPTLGGYLVDHVSWHWIFYINLPIGVFTVMWGWLALEETPLQEDLKLDWLGLLLVAGAAFALLLALSKGQDWGWTSPGIVYLVVGGLFATALFILWELSVPNPVLDVRLILNPTFVASMAASNLTSIALFVAIFLIPLFCQNVQGYSAMQTGLIMMPAALVTALFMPIAGKVFDTVGAVWPGLVGMVVVALVTHALVHLTADIPTHYLQILLCVRNAGLALAMMPLMTAGINTIPTARTGQATAIASVTRQVAASFGIALVSYVLTNRMAFHVERLAEQVSLLNPLSYSYYIRFQDVLGGLAPGATPALLMGVIQKQAMVMAMGDAFWVAFWLVLLAFPFIPWLTPRRVKEELRRQEERLEREKGSLQPSSNP
ncbi:DHA2 family efflux MFS transporter permease subunit [Desulfothermobacter acidiphilus]|uniref:DHA2 family efflux MFS transporter permease subunit n=1 Tax=Desulfothermobacter acidiphilus TaxID=1938353 RepID=UPI003F8915D4